MFPIYIVNYVFYMMSVNRSRKIHVLACILVHVVKRFVKFIHKNYVIMPFKFKA